MRQFRCWYWLTCSPYQPGREGNQHIPAKTFEQEGCPGQECFERFHVSHPPHTGGSPALAAMPAAARLSRGLGVAPQQEIRKNCHAIQVHAQVEKEYPFDDGSIVKMEISKPLMDFRAHSLSLHEDDQACGKKYHLYRNARVQRSEKTAMPADAAPLLATTAVKPYPSNCLVLP